MTRIARAALPSAFLFLAASACGASAAGQKPSETGAQRAFDDAAAPDSTPKELGALPEGECGTQSLITQMGTSCKRIDASSASATGIVGQTHAKASDNDACTVWSSGGMPPQSITIDLGAPTAVSGMMVIPDATPPLMEATHRIEMSLDGGSWHPVVDVKGSMVSGHGYAVPFASKVTARLLRVTTVGAPAFVAWREITAVSCP
jgi:hypothetical protein